MFKLGMLNLTYVEIIHIPVMSSRLIGKLFVDKVGD